MEEIRTRRVQQRNTGQRSSAMLGGVCGQSYVPQREQCHCPCSLSRSRSKSCAVAAINLGSVSFRGLTRIQRLCRALQFGNGLYGRGIELLLYADCKRVCLADGRDQVHRNLMEKGPFLSKSVSKFIAHDACPRASCQIKRRVRSPVRAP